jgi:hypothetical protein
LFSDSLHIIYLTYNEEVVYIPVQCFNAESWGTQHSSHTNEIPKHYISMKWTSLLTLFIEAIFWLRWVCWFIFTFSMVILVALQLEISVSWYHNIVFPSFWMVRCFGYFNVYYIWTKFSKQTHWNTSRYTHFRNR